MTESSVGRPSVGKHSASALTAAAARAAHLIVDSEPRIFADSLAAALLGDRSAELISYHELHGTHPVLAGARVQVTGRSRYAEDALARAAAGADRAAGAAGIAQYVILGAGLDSFAYRGEPGGPAGALRVFEVDQPASQEVKRAALRDARIAVPGHVRFVPVELSADAPAVGGPPDGPAGGLAGDPPADPVSGPGAGLRRALTAAGFDWSAPAFVAWLGVTMYLAPAAVAATLGELGRLAPGSEVVADYFLPAGGRDEAGEQYAALVGPASAAQGEPWRSFFTPAQFADLARRSGFGAVRSVSQREMVPAGLWRRSDSLRPARLAMLFHGRVSRTR
jgi:O-methyltransferase involved in polyketide biosynthesis